MKKNLLFIVCKFLLCINYALGQSLPACQELKSFFKDHGENVPVGKSINFYVPSESGCTYQWTVNENIISGQTLQEVIFANVVCAQVDWRVIVVITNSNGSITLSRNFTYDCDSYTHMTPVDTTTHSSNCSLPWGSPATLPPIGPDCQTMRRSYHDQTPSPYGKVVSFFVNPQPDCTYSWKVNGVTITDTHSEIPSSMYVNNVDGDTQTSWAVSVTITNAVGSKVVSGSWTLDCSNPGSYMTASYPQSCIDPSTISPGAKTKEIYADNIPSQVVPGYYPNPANSQITITSRKQSTTVGSPYQFRIYNKLGKVIKAGSSAGADTNVRLTDVAAGTYILHLVIDGQTITKQIIINH